jgi:hypothetical protein
MTTRIITGTTGVWLTQYSSIGPKELAESDGERLVNGFQYGSHDMTGSGWTRIGEAQVHITLKSTDEILLSKVDALKAQKTKLQAETQEEITRIDEQIQNLLAISYEPA